MGRLTTLSRSIEGKVALVTGAASGIGAATARILAEAGADLALAWYPPDGHDIEPVVKAVHAVGRRAVVAPRESARAEPSGRGACRAVHGGDEQVDPAVRGARSGGGRVELFMAVMKGRHSGSRSAGCRGGVASCSCR